MIQEVPEETTTEITEKQEIEITDEETLDHNTILATHKTDNIYPLDEIWINAKTGISQTLAIQESADKKERTLNEMLEVITVPHIVQPESGRLPADYGRTTTKLPLENYMNFYINFWWLFGGCLTRQLVQQTFQWTVQ